MVEPTPSPPVQPRGWFAHLRGLLVAVHLVAITLLALPSAGEGAARWTWKDPTVQEEFATWTGRLNRCGIHITTEQFEDMLWEIDSTYESVRGRITGPFNRYYSRCGTYQSWRMFAGPQRYPCRLHIDVEENGVWRPVYVQRDPDHAWLSSRLDHYRMRPFLYRLSWYRHVTGFSDFEELAQWIARQAAVDFPRAERVRVRFFAFHTRSPEEVKAGQPVEGEFVSESIVGLEARR